MARDELAHGTMPKVDYVAGVPDSGVPHAMATPTARASTSPPF
jgi:amidophosphoribosyltransferase